MVKLDVAFLLLKESVIIFCGYTWRTILIVNIEKYVQTVGKYALY
jgi:hypothetical protein